MSRRSNIPVDTTYIPIGSDVSRKRVKEISDKHRIEERGNAAGQKNEPPETDTELDAHQRALLGESESFVSALTRIAKAEITERINQMRALMPAPLGTALEQSSVRSKVAEERDRYRDDLELAFAERQRMLRDLRRFEERNRLGPLSAIYKEDTAMFVAVLLVLILGESFFNAFSFEELQERGLLGGLMLAVMVSVANVLMGLGCGYIGWRLMGHVRWDCKLLRMAVTGVLMTAALALHLALGDLREAISHDVKAHIDFLVVLKPSRWFAYTSIPPAVLFAVGVATFIICAFKGRGGAWGVSAPYWHHDVMDRRFRAADRVFEDAKANLKDALQNGFNGERSKLRARIDDDISHVREIRRLQAEAEAIKATLGDSIEDEIGRQHIWQRIYRDANRTVRTKPAPAYFDVYPGFEEWRSNRLDLSEVERLGQAAEKVLAENLIKVAAVEEKMLQEQTAAVDGMLTLLSASERRAAQQVDKDDNPDRPRAI